MKIIRNYTIFSFVFIILIIVISITPFIEVNSSSNQGGQEVDYPGNTIINTSEIVYPLSSYIVTANYGIYYPFGSATMHYGIDLAAPTGTPIYGSGNGIVYDSLYSEYSGNCTYILYKFEDYTLSVAYFHQSKINVDVGDTIDNNTVIGLVGNTGLYTTGSHLHYETAIIPASIAIEQMNVTTHNEYRVNPRTVVSFPILGGSYNDEKREII